MAEKRKYTIVLQQQFVVEAEDDIAALVAVKDMAVKDGRSMNVQVMPGEQNFGHDH